MTGLARGGAPPPRRSAKLRAGRESVWAPATRPPPGGARWWRGGGGCGGDPRRPSSTGSGPGPRHCAPRQPGRPGCDQTRGHTHTHDQPRGCVFSLGAPPPPPLAATLPLVDAVLRLGHFRRLSTRPSRGGGGEGAAAPSWEALRRPRHCACAVIHIGVRWARFGLACAAAVFAGAAGNYSAVNARARPRSSPYGGWLWTPAYRRKGGILQSSSRTGGVAVSFAPQRPPYAHLPPSSPSACVPPPVCPPNLVRPLPHGACCAAAGVAPCQRSPPFSLRRLPPSLPRPANRTQPAPCAHILPVLPTSLRSLSVSFSSC